MPNQPTSFRFPFNLGGKVHPEAEQAIRYAFSGLKDANDAIRALSDKVNAKGATVATTVTAATIITGSGGGGSPTSPIAGRVNDQTGNTAVTLQQTDYGALVILDDASPIAVTLNSAVAIPFFSVLENQGTGLATLTPSSGLVNTIASIPLPPNSPAIVFFDGFNWWATPIYPQPSAIVPKADSGSGTVGVSLNYSREDHIHPDSGAVFINATLAGVTGILNLQIFANNAAAVAGGLTSGTLYRNGSNPDGIFVVH